MNYEAIEKIDLCKYAKVISLQEHIKCKYKDSIFHNGIFISTCPMDSGTDGQHNGKCAEAHLKRIEG